MKKFNYSELMLRKPKVSRLVNIWRYEFGIRMTSIASSVSEMTISNI